MTRSLGIALALAGLLAAAGTGPAQAAGPVTVPLTPQNTSGESGTATLTTTGVKLFPAYASFTNVTVTGFAGSYNFGTKALSLSATWCQIGNTRASLQSRRKLHGK